MKNFDQLTEASDSEKQINGKESGNDLIYEEIEAPKFVDFTVPDYYHPDDRYWFCLRVGCDQKHGEELDLEEINKNFILRVMAARSPNIKIRKMLTRKQQSSTLRCPLTAPSKPSKARISRVAVIPSISRKLFDAKDKAKPILKPISKHSQLISSSAKKSFTTPRNRKRVSSNLEKFRSTRNPKPTETSDIVGLKNRVVAKALVFNSPPRKKKVEPKTPVAKLCSAMSKLDIETGNKKRPLMGSKVTDTPVGALCLAMKKLEIASGKKSELGLGKTPEKRFRVREVKSRVFDSLKPSKKRKEIETGKEKENKNEKGNDSSDHLEIDEKSKQGSSEEEKANSSKPKTTCEENINKSYDKENASPLDGAEEEVNENDDNREPKDNSEERILTNHDLKKVKEVMKKPLKKSCVGQEKYRKPKPTNPKPFRLRTDERGILKEATMEKKLATPFKEITSTTVKLPGLKSSTKKATPSHSESENVETDLNQPRTTVTTSDKISQKTKSPKKLLRPQGIGWDRKTGVIEEGSEPRILKRKESVKPSGKSTSQGIKKHSGVPRSVSRGRMGLTIPKEPNFHCIRVPKSCTKKVS